MFVTILFVHVWCSGVGIGETRVYVTATVQRAWDNLRESILSFYLFIDYRDQIQVTRLMQKVISHLTNPVVLFIIICI